MIVSFKRLFFVLVILLKFNTCSFSQEYLSKYVKLDFLANPTHFEFFEDTYKVYSINFIDGISTSSIIELNHEFDTIRIINYPNISFARSGPRNLNGNFFAYVEDEINIGEHGVLKMDREFNELERKSFLNEYASFGASSMSLTDNKIIGSSFHYIDCPDEDDGNCEFMNFDIFDSDLNKINSIKIGTEYSYFFSAEMSVSSSGKLLCGGNHFSSSGAKATIYNFDTSGVVNWKYVNDESQTRGNVPVNLIELSNNNFVFTDKISKQFDFEYLSKGYTPSPAQLVWISPDGDSIFSFLDTINYLSSSEFNGVTKGQGDYFYAYGQINKVSLLPKESDGVYSFIIKLTNDGEIVWRKNFRHSEEKFTVSFILKLIEHDNGDLATIGIEVSSAGYNLWAMRMSENGCLDSNDTCSNYIILPTIEDNFKNINDILIFPNPATDEVQIQCSEMPLKTSIYHLNGSLIFEKYHSKNIDISDLNSGMYMIRTTFDDYHYTTALFKTQ